MNYNFFFFRLTSVYRVSCRLYVFILKMVCIKLLQGFIETVTLFLKELHLPRLLWLVLGKKLPFSVLWYSIFYNIHKNNYNKCANSSFIRRLRIVNLAMVR